MAEVEKFDDAGVMMLLKHSERQLTNDSNTDIIVEKSDLNYSLDIKCNGMTPKEFYKKMKNESYLYGRGTKREASAVTCCSWVITLPKSVSNYSLVGKDEIKILHPESEKAFFQGVNQFVTDRYGTVFYNRVHYDEGGQPHIHIYFVPITHLDHNQVHYKTVKTHHAIKTESGRYEFEYRYKLKNGERIPLQNYAKMSDYFDTKISGADVLNKAELQHFHSDLAEYLKKNNLPGADSVHTGITDGKNISVKSMKEFTKATGITIDQLKEHPLGKEELKELLDSTELKLSVRSTIESINSEAVIDILQSQVKESAARTTELEKRIAEMEKTIESKELEKAKSVEFEEAAKGQEWGSSSASWGNTSHPDWGAKTADNDIEKSW